MHSVTLIATSHRNNSKWGRKPVTSEVDQTDKQHRLTRTHNAIIHQTIDRESDLAAPSGTHHVFPTLRRPIHRPRRPNRCLHPSNRSLLHQTPRHDPRDLCIRRRRRTVSLNIQSTNQRRPLKETPPMLPSLSAKTATPSNSAARR